jgi:hypothetical protein
MSKPIWDAVGNNQSLADTGYDTIIGSPQARVMSHSIPRVDGQAVGLLGVGPRIITVTGFFEGATNASAAIAIQNVKSAMGLIQTFVGTEIKSFTDSDSKIYVFCVMLSFQPTGRVEVRFAAAAGVFIAHYPITCTILQQEATNP